MGNVEMRRCRFAHVLQTGIALGLFFMLTGFVLAESPYEATSSRAARDEAIRTIPFDALNAQTQARLSSVIKKPSIYRRMPLEAIHSDPDMYLFLVRYPEVLVNIWRIMGITECITKRTGAYSLTGIDGQGTSCNVELIYGTPELHVLFAEGTYDGGLLRKVSGRAVIVLRSGYANDAENRSIVTNRLDMFLQLDNVGVDLLAKSFSPLITKTADYNFVQSAQFIGRISALSESNGPGVQGLAERMNDIDPVVRARFADLVSIVSHRAALRAAGVRQSPAAQAGYLQNQGNSPSQ